MTRLQHRVWPGVRPTDDVSRNKISAQGSNPPRPFAWKRRGAVRYGTALLDDAPAALMNKHVRLPGIVCIECQDEPPPPAERH